MEDDFVLKYLNMFYIARTINTRLSYLNVLNLDILLENAENSALLYCSGNIN